MIILNVTLLFCKLWCYRLGSSHKLSRLTTLRHATCADLPWFSAVAAVCYTINLLHYSRWNHFTVTSCIARSVLTSPCCAMLCYTTMSWSHSCHNLTLENISQPLRITTIEMDRAWHTESFPDNRFFNTRRHRSFNYTSLWRGRTVVLCTQHSICYPAKDDSVTRQQYHRSHDAPHIAVKWTPYSVLNSWCM